MGQEFKDLIANNVFALLLVENPDGEVILRPIGGKYGASIVKAVEEMNEKYPESKMKLFYQDCDYNKYFKDIVPRERVYPWADLREEELSQIKKFREELYGCRCEPDS